MEDGFDWILNLSVGLLVSLNSFLHLTCVGVQVRKTVDVFTRVPAERDAEADLKVKGFEQEVAKEVPLNQPEAVHCPAAHRELQPGEHLLYFSKTSLLNQKLRTNYTTVIPSPIYYIIYVYI